ncbi:hypothetical protein N5K37_32450 [Delftia tsuruhatensis]|uniref:hypothetical protein n=1 Tax=Delftia tsuruhatensis TaxID=180282 RepID=UPI000B2889E7|nr:hypothetical protein [Delftia tsuruhatensis]MDH2234622.1 hypothetical protein [Delftia tsuruhatensis]
MTQFLAVIGACFIVAMIIGAVVPGMNFHVVFAGDEAAQRWHQRLAAELQTRIQEKQP